jgi:hypothetical protein
MALTSPGVEVTIIDESQYIPAATNSVPYILLATAQNKISGAGVGVAPGTLAADANRVNLITSQRDLLATYGNPFFYNTTAGTPINGYELNEYGLLAAYSALGVSNRCYVQRVNIDLAELTASLTRPTGSPPNNTYWFDVANTNWGIFQWNQTTSAFTNQIPTFLTDTVNLQNNSTVPLQSYGSIGDYAVVATTGITGNTPINPTYYKRGGPTTSQAPGWLQGGQTADQLYNTWVLVGSDEWKTAWPAVQGTTAPTTLSVGATITINDITLSVPAAPNNTITGLVNLINTVGPDGVYAANVGGRLFVYADSFAEDDGSTQGGLGVVNISAGTVLSSVGIATGLYYAPEYLPAPSFQAPRWRTTDTQPEPTGSVWQKTNNVNLGANIVIKRYSSTLGEFVQQACPLYETEFAAIYALDPSGGGLNIPSGTTYGNYDPKSNDTAGLQLLARYASGPTIITGADTTPGPFVSGNQFLIQASEPGTPNATTATVTLSGTTAVDFVSSVSAANIPNVGATINSSGAIVFTHATGGTIVTTPVVGDAMNTAGFNTTVTGVRVRNVDGTGLILSNFAAEPQFVYIASSTAPSQDPVEGRLWYYSATDQADIMIQNNGAWVGYQTVANDVRGDNLTLTNVAGPIFAAAPPATQTNTGLSPLVYGDLWINTSDLENYPALYRWSNQDGQDQWVQIDNTDQTTENGVLFADARWAPNGSTNPITDPLPTITSLLVSNYLDLDAPSPTLYPQGMLLFNTRRSGFNVKQFEVNYFNSNAFAGETLPAEKNAWVTASGNRNDGSPYMGRQAQRALIVAALKSGIDTSTSAREEQKTYNLIACPQYPELLVNMIALNNERNNTAFIIADTPLRLAPNEIANWATNADGEGLPTADGLSAGDVYAGTFYPSCQTVDLSGSPVVQPPSHMMIRTIIRSDEVAFPWLAPAGTRRGVVDNAQQLGYVNAATGEFESLGVRQGLRDELYLNRINPITFIPGVGITNFGNKTLTSITSALDRINVARLIAFIRGRLETIGKQFLFEPNDQITRNEITNAIDSLMIDLVAKRGIYDYLIVCDLTNNTPARIDRNELYVDIAIEPVKAVEFIFIPLRIRNTGEIAGATSGTQSGSAG